MESDGQVLRLAMARAECDRSMQDGEIREQLKTIFVQNFFRGESEFDTAVQEFLEHPDKWDVFGREHSVTLLVSLIRSLTHNEVFQAYITRKTTACLAPEN